MEASQAKSVGDLPRHVYYQKQVDCFTNQLNESNPILTKISNAMTQEGYYQELIKRHHHGGDDDDTTVLQELESKLNEATQQKLDGNHELLECSAKYETMMRTIREGGI